MGLRSPASNDDPDAAPHVATYDEIASQLTDGFRRFWGGPRGPHYGAETGDTVTVNVNWLTPEGQRLARWALEAWTNVTGIEFQFVSGGADITFFDDADETATGTQRRVNVPIGWILQDGARIDSHAFKTYIHEIGHALGLGHPGDYPRHDQEAADVTYADAKFLNDSWQASVMSYYAGSNAGVRVHLGAGTGNRGHAQGDTLLGIEHLEGSAHADTLTGNEAANWLWGGAGADTLGGADGSDTLAGGVGADRMDGGAGNDWLWYAGSDAGVEVDLGTGRGSGGQAEGDTFSDVEGIIGSAHADHLRGGRGSDTLRGGGGSDWLYGEAGADRLEGGAELDRLTGGGGNDTFVFDPGTWKGMGVIRDFADDPSPSGEQDVIELSGVSSFSSLVFTPRGTDLIITTDDETGNIYIVLREYLVDHETGDLTQEDFLFA